MKVYLSEDYNEVTEKFVDFELGNYSDSNDIVILPGGLGSLKDMIQGICDKKNVYICNVNSCYDPIIHQFDKLYENGKESRMADDYVKIVGSVDEVLVRLEEKKNVNNGEISKLL